MSVGGLRRRAAERIVPVLDGADHRDARVPEQTQFCDYLTFADSYNTDGAVIITMTVGTGNATLDSVAIPVVSDVVSGQQNGLAAAEGLTGFVEDQPACVEYYVEVAESAVGKSGSVGPPPAFCFAV